VGFGTSTSRRGRVKDIHVVGAGFACDGNSLSFALEAKLLQAAPGAPVGFGHVDPDPNNPIATDDNL
jgi:hypothetical protein